MSLFQAVKATSNVCGTTIYHLTLGALKKPRASREFVRTVANTIVEFRPRPQLLLPKILLSELCPGADALELPMRVTLSGDHELPPEEYLCMAGLVHTLKPSRVFEIGTHRGRTTRLIADYSGAHTRIHTMDLPPERMMEARCFPEARSALIGEQFRNHPMRAKITQLYADSQTFDFSPYQASMDLVFVDGDHTYEGVKRDSENALRMIRPGGLILWDDYHQRFGDQVMEYLHELAKTLPVYRIQSTRFAVYRSAT